MEEGISRKNLTGECLRAKGLQFLYGKMSKFFMSVKNGFIVTLFDLQNGVSYDQDDMQSKIGR